MSCPMAHQMGLVKLNPTTKSVATTLTYTYNKEDGGYTSSTSGTSTITASNDFTGNKPYSISSQYWHIVKATGTSTNTAMEFTCNANQKDFWSPKLSGTDVGYGRYKVIDIQSDREAANFVALFSCVRKSQAITLPWYGEYIMECWGAKGGETSTDTRGKAGKGGYTKGNITLEKGFVLYVYVGSAGASASTASDSNPGGWNGGGYSGGNGGSSNHTRFSCGGGGSTDVRVTPHTSGGWGYNTITNTGDASLSTRIMVAAGGGGSGKGQDDSGKGYYITGSYGGGLKGGLGTQTPASYNLGVPADQEKGGTCLYNSDNTASFGYAPQNAGTPGFGGGGGGGWYGGARGHGRGGSGGSSFISGMTNCKAVNSNGTSISANYMTIIVNGLNKAFKFSNTEMIDGEGYVWTSTTRPASATKQSTITSNPGGNNGFAKITSQ